MSFMSTWLNSWKEALQTSFECAILFSAGKIGIDINTDEWNYYVSVLCRRMQPWIQRSRLPKVVMQIFAILENCSLYPSSNSYLIALTDCLRVTLPLSWISTSIQPTSTRKNPTSIENDQCTNKKRRGPVLSTGPFILHSKRELDW